PVLVLMLLNATMWLIANFIVYTYLAELLERVTHLADSAISGMIFLFGLASVLGNALGGYGADRWGATRMLVIGMIGLAIAFLVLPWASVTVWGVAIVLVVWGVFGWMLMTPQQHRLIALSPQSANIVLSLNGSALYIGSGTGAIVGGLTLRFFSVQALGWVGGTITLLALVVLFVCLRATSVARLTEQQAEILREEAVA
ncbi:MAG: MFS transporter, partial [Ktedonobacteraceae bacterium]|nr:MFS transporter [Ktedonobacteraceae bacterium]